MAYQLFSDRILPHVGKFFRVMIDIPHLRIPYIHLPSALQGRKILARQALPIRTPFFHTLRMRQARHTEKMQVIRHAQKFAHPPLHGILPCPLNGLHRRIVVKQGVPPHNAYRAKDNDGFIKSLNRRVVRGILPFG